MGQSIRTPVEKAPKKVHVFVPATVANMACGFDILGFAVSAPGDEVVATLSDQPGVRMVAIHGTDRLPLDAAKNTASVSAQACLDFLDSKIGIDITLHKKMPLGSGLGSSASSAAAGAFAANLLLGSPLSPADLVQFAMHGEKVACGSAHADNVAPALVGGFVLIRSYSPLDIISIPTKLSLYCSIIHPHVEVRTEDARKILRREILLKSAITQWGNIAGLVAGLMKNDAPLVGRSLEDVIIEPERALLIPGFDAIKGAAIGAGALGSSISGSGPAIFALSVDEKTANIVSDAMRTACTQIGLTSDCYVSPINHVGARILSQS